jgi:hypothetical protein
VAEGALLGQVCMEGQLGVDDPLVNKGVPHATTSAAMTLGGTHLEFLMKEPSMEAFLRSLLPRLLPQNQTFAIEARWDSFTHPFEKHPGFPSSRGRSRGITEPACCERTVSTRLSRFKPLVR